MSTLRSGLLIGLLLLIFAGLSTGPVGLPAGTTYGGLIMKSTDGGRTFSSPVDVGPWYDKPYLASDPATGALYVVGNAVDSLGGGVFFSKSVDGGATFTPLQRITPRGGG